MSWFSDYAKAKGIEVDMTPSNLMMDTKSRIDLYLKDIKSSCVEHKRNSKMAAAISACNNAIKAFEINDVDSLKFCVTMIKIYTVKSSYLGIQDIGRKAMELEQILSTIKRKGNATADK